MFSEKETMNFSIKLCCLVISILVVSHSNKCVLGAGADNDVSCQNPNFLVISTIDGILTALDGNTGKNCWSVVLNSEKFLSSSLSQVKTYENGREVSLVPSLDGGLYKYDKFNKEIVPLPFDVDSLINQPFFFDSSTSIIGGKIKYLYGINSLTGEIIYVCKKSSCNSFISSFPENILVIEETSQFANAIDSSKAEQKWHFRVSDLTAKLASQSSSFNPFENGSQQNAIIPRIYQDFVNLDLDIPLYKISLQNGFAGMINKTTQDFSWSFKSSSPITDVWYIKDNLVKNLDPFESESGFFSIDDGQHFALLFLGSFENQLFIKKSKNFSMKQTSFEENAVSRIIFYKSYVIPVCSKSENSVVLGSSFRREDLNPSLRLNVTDYGTYFYINYTVFENKTHCIINKTFTEKHDSISILNNQILVIYIFACAVTCIISFIIFPKLVLNYLKRKYKDMKRSLDYELASSIKDKEFHSRFDQDFEYLSTLGRGGYGIVMDVKNKIDDCRYAVKRICLHERLNKTQYEKVLREVKALAKLDHHGIVRYFNAWTEYPPVGWQEERDKVYKITCLVNSSCDTTISDSSNLMERSRTIKSAPNSHSETDSERISKDKKQKGSKDNFQHKLIQNPLAVPEDDLLNIDSEFSTTISSEEQDRNSASLFNTYTKLSESDQSTSNEDSSEEVGHDSQLYQHMKESNDSFSVVFEDPNESLPHEDNVLAEYSGLHRRTSVHISKSNRRQLESAKEPMFPFQHKSKVSSTSSKDIPRGYLYIQMQLCQKDSLQNWIYLHNEHRNYDKVMQIFSEIVEAVDYVHNCGLMHRDLKPSNIYFSLEGAIKIGDFGLATSSEIADNNINNSIQSCVHTSDIGTELYMSPEQKMNDDYDYKTDIYSLGIILFELLVPFKTLTERIKVLLDVRELRLPYTFTAKFVKESELLKNLLHKDPANRPTTEEIRRSLMLIKVPSAEAP